MGANGSKTQVHVQCERPFYYVGDIVTGFIALHTEQAMEFNKINIKVTGVEKCEWQETHNAGKTTTTTTYSGKQVIFKNKLPVMGSGTLNPGDYQWPFSFQLPHNIPGSFNYHSGQTKASIQYKVKAEYDQVGLLKPDFKKTIKIEVLERHKATPPQALVMAGEEPISFFCCFSKGVVGLKVTADTDSYLPGDSIALRAQVDNKSSEDVPCVEFRVQQKLQLTAKTLFGDRKKGFSATKVFQKQQMPGYPNGAAGSVSHYEAQLHLERNLEATCHSQLIHSTYELEVVAKTGCCLSEVVLRKPLLLLDPQPVEVPPAVVPPQGWAPQVYPTFQFQLPAVGGYNAYPTAPPAQAPGVPPPHADYGALMPPPYQMQLQQQQQQQQQPASITYNITNVTNNYADPVKVGAPASPGAAVAAYQEGYGAGVSAGVQPPRDAVGWASPEGGHVAAMPGAVTYPVVM